MLGFGKKDSRDEKETLKRRNDRLREQRDFALSRHETSRAVSAIVAGKFTDAHTFGWDENARLAEQVDGYQNLLTRHARLLRAAQRYLTEVWRLRAEVAELKAKDGVPDRAIDPAVPTPELLRTRRELAEARAQLRPLQDRLDAYQRVSEAADWKLAKRSGVRVDAPKALAS